MYHHNHHHHHELSHDHQATNQRQQQVLPRFKNARTLPRSAGTRAPISRLQRLCSGHGPSGLQSLRPSSLSFRISERRRQQNFQPSFLTYKTSTVVCETCQTRCLRCETLSGLTTDCSVGDTIAADRFDKATRRSSAAVAMHAMCCCSTKTRPGARACNAPSRKASPSRGPRT